MRGGALARGIRLTFEQDLTKATEDAFFASLRKHLGDDAGYTKVGPGQVVVINYRDGETGLPAMNDETFLDGIQDLVDGHGKVTQEAFGSEGQYGPVHDWRADPKGDVVRRAANTAGRPDIQGWLRDRRAAFETLVETYSGEELAEREAQLAWQAWWQAQTLEQRAFHGTPFWFRRFLLDHIGTGEGAMAFGWGLYFAERRGVAEFYRESVHRFGGAEPTIKVRGKTLAEATDNAWVHSNITTIVGDMQRLGPGTSFETAQREALADLFHRAHPNKGGYKQPANDRVRAGIFRGLPRG